MKQQTLATAADQGSSFERYRRSTKRDVFLATMNEIVPWQAPYEVIEPHYPKRGNGRPPIGLGRMLRMYFIQHWFNLADEACGGNERRVYVDSAYASQKALIEAKAPRAQDFANQRVRRAAEQAPEQRAKNRSKSRVRARVEHVFAVVKRLWGFSKVRYRGLAKNATRSFVALGLANIYLARHRLA